MKIKRLMTTRRVSEFDLQDFTDRELSELGERISRAGLDEIVIWLRWAVRQVRALTKSRDDLKRLGAQIEQLRLDAAQLRGMLGTAKE
jgi:hypothetical protein